MTGNRALEAIKRLLTADTYVCCHDQSAQREPSSTAGTEQKPESPSAVAKPEVPPRPEAS